VVDGDVIALGNGVFRGHENRDIDFLGKAITLRSRGGDPEACVIDCEGNSTDPHRGFYFGSREDADTIIEGVSVINGYAPEAPFHRGGAAYCDDAGPRFIDCVFAGNTAEREGGAVFSSNEVSFNAFSDCVFSNNHAETGGAVAGSPSSFVFDHCTFSENLAANAGGAVAVGVGNQLFTSCTFVRNSAGGTGGCVAGGSVRIERCTMFSNSAESGSAVSGSLNGSWILHSIIASGSGQAVHGVYWDLFCCDVWGNAGGDWVGPIEGQCGINENISLDPMFCDPASDALTLEAGSPCQAGYNPDCGLLGAWPVACGDPASLPEPPEDDPPATAASWGALKAMFR
jgi:predicted outer membrane repeat protein